MASTDFINECKTPANEDRLGKIVIDNVEYNQGNYLSELELEDSIYNNGTIIGATYTKSLKASLINVNKDTEFVGKKANPSIGVKYGNNSTEYLDFDEYTIESLNDEQTENSTSFVGYDALNILDSKFEYTLDDSISTAHTVLEYWGNLLENLGLETETTTFTNDDIIIPANPFVGGETNRTVLSEIEKVSCNFSTVEKRTRTVEGVTETYYVLNLNWFDEGTLETETINGTGTIEDVNKILSTELLGNTYQADAILPNEYTQVDYIQSSGTQYIDTGFKPNQNTRMTAKIYINGLVSTYDNIGGARNGNTNQFHIIIVNNRFDARYGTQNSNISFTTTGLFNFDFNKNNLYINNNLAKTFTNTTFTSNYNAYIFAVNNGGSATQKANYKLYNMKWYDNDTLVRDFIPCYRNSDNEVGLYDLVNNVFYTNQGTGSFTYGSVTPIPNPDYPQTITSVTGTNTIKIAGKNLFDGVLELGNYNTNTGEKVANNNYIINTNPIPVEELTNYKISSNGTGIRMYVFEYKEDMTYNLNTRKTVNDNEYLTTNSGTKYINFRTIDVNTNLQEKIQVEKGTSLTSFEAYKGQNYTINLGSLELCKIGTYKDRIYPLNGKWYLEKKIGKVVLIGTENWNYQSEHPRFIMNLSPRPVNGAMCYATTYIKGQTSSAGSNNTISVASGTGYSQLLIHDERFATKNDYNNWLSTHNVEVYYPLETPTTTEITDENLIVQLESIELLDGINNITIMSENLTASANINYYEKVINYEFQTNDYSTLEGSLTRYGPVNCVLIGNKDISGENVYLEDTQSITINGETKVLIDSPYFLFNQTLREQAIQGVYDKLKGLQYYDLKLTTFYGKPFLKTGDRIRVNTNEGNVYDTYILQHTFTYNGTFKSVVSSPALTKQEEITKSTGNITNRINRTEIMVDKANQRIDSVIENVTENTVNISTMSQTVDTVSVNLSKTQSDLEEASSSIEDLQVSVNGLINQTSTSGGTNLVKDSMGALNDGSWVGDNNTDIDVENISFPDAIGLNAIVIGTTRINQAIDVKNGVYTLSYKYRKASGKVGNMTSVINNNENTLSDSLETENGYVKTITVTTGVINLSFVGTIDELGCVYDIMINMGEGVKTWEQNQDETTTDTVKIGKGIEVSSNVQKTTTKMNADGFRVTSNVTNEEIMYATDKGGGFRELESHSTSKINGAIFLNIDGHVWITGVSE